jgi:broad specificity phosphatase PhoE
MPTLYLVRHGEPEIIGVMLGQLDPPLSSDGRTRAMAALSRIDVEVVWTSPLRRARETAELIRSGSVVELPELREIDQGDWEGKTWTEIEANWPDLAARKLSDWLGVAPPGGESWTSFLERVDRAWKTIRAGVMPTAISAHQGVNAALTHLIEGRDPLEFVQGYGEVIQLEYD